MTHDEFEKLLSDVVSRCDEKFVRIENCDARYNDNAAHFAKLEAELLSMNTKLSWLVGILACIGIAVVGAIVASIFGG